ncbi:MAG: zinc ribbon domain-containing protein [Acidobacteria bacterium]|nr:zinc ribbon domain-containing protein [Acidobacteriota bacterium]
MPMYEYRCEACGRKFEMLRRMSDADTNLICPQCESSQVQRQFSMFAAGGCGTGGGGRFS